MEKALGCAWSRQPTSASDLLSSVPQRLADAAENFQKAHRWQDNIKVRTTASSPTPRVHHPRKVKVKAGEQGECCSDTLCGGRGGI